MPAPYTIRIFVVDGDPDGVRIIDRFNWTGKGFFFPRKKWSDIRNRPEFNFAGVYILFADAPSENELPIVSKSLARDQPPEINPQRSSVGRPPACVGSPCGTRGASTRCSPPEDVP